MVILDHCQLSDIDRCTVVMEEGVLVFRKGTLKCQEVMGIKFATDSEMIQKKKYVRLHRHTRANVVKVGNLGEE